MNAHKFRVKMYAADGTPAASAFESFIPIFHEWIKQRKLGDELVIDVANYAHVPQGPGVALIGDEGDYYLENTDGRVGLLWSRKRYRAAALTLAQGFADACLHLVRAAQLAEQDAPGLLRFRTDELSVSIADRLNAPNQPSTLEAVRPAFTAVLDRLYGSGAWTLASIGLPKQLFTVQVRAQQAPDLAALHARLVKD